MRLENAIALGSLRIKAGGAGSGCKGDNCGRPKIGGGDKEKLKNYIKERGELQPASSMKNNLMEDVIKEFATTYEKLGHKTGYFIWTKIGKGYEARAIQFSRKRINR